MKDTKKVLIVYHSEDNDGVCSAAIVKAFLQCSEYWGYDNPSYSIQTLGVTHSELKQMWENFNNHVCIGDNPVANIETWEKQDMLFMVDISFGDTKPMNLLYEHFKYNFFWCDHHKPIIDVSKSEPFGNARGVRKIEQSALLNTWEFMCNLLEVNYEPSNWLKMLSDYDSWAWASMDKYKDEAAREELFCFNTGVSFKSNLNVDWFVEWIVENIYWFGDHGVRATECMTAGVTIRTHDKRRLGKAIQENGDCGWIANGEKTCAVITTEYINSLMFSEFVKDKDVKHGAVFKKNATTDNWTLSLYNLSNDDTFHCGKYLKEKYGGGGHLGAAGCVLDNETAFNMIKTRKI